LEKAAGGYKQLYPLWDGERAMRRGGWVEKRPGEGDEALQLGCGEVTLLMALVQFHGRLGTVA
jgi:hypothetical protein